jgi:hypothetical protein
MGPIGLPELLIVLFLIPVIVLLARWAFSKPSK